MHSTHVLQLSLMTQLAHTPQAVLRFVAEEEAVIRRERLAGDEEEEVGVERGMIEKETGEREVVEEEREPLEEEETEAKRQCKVTASL